MQHYIYKTTFIDTGEYYIGKHSTNKINDNYVGSGKALTKEKLSEPFVHEILEYFDTEEEAYIAEDKAIGDLYLTDKKCLNRCGGGWRGKADNRKGKFHSEDWKRKISQSNSKPKEGVALQACLENSKKGIEARTGMKDSNEVKLRRAQSLSKALTGVPQPQRRKKLLINGDVINGLQQAAEKYNITTNTVRNRINSDKFPDWQLL